MLRVRVPLGLFSSYIFLLKKYKGDEIINKKLNKKYSKELKELQNVNDTEIAHIKADDVLCNLLMDLGYQEIVDNYNKIYKWFA